METMDALIVSIAGMTVVFSGLIITSLIIYSFSSVPRLIASLKSKKSEKTSSARKVENENIDPDVIAVIATVLEVERRLHASYQQSKFTFKDRRTASGLI